MGRKTDQFWGYVERLPNRRFKCTFCDSEFCGGASRIKAHLARLSGRGIAICPRVSEGVQEQANEWIKTSKKLKSASTSVNAKEVAYEEFIGWNGNAYEEGMGLIPTGKRLKTGSTSVNAKEDVQAEAMIATNKKLGSASTSVNAKERIIFSIEKGKNFTEVFI